MLAALNSSSVPWVSVRLWALFSALKASTGSGKRILTSFNLATIIIIIIKGDNYTNHDWCIQYSK